MNTKKLSVFLSVLFFAAAVYAQGQDLLRSDKQPDFADYSRRWCRIDLSAPTGKMDFRSCDLSKRDLSGLNRQAAMRYLNFDDKTIWPGSGQMPRWLDPAEIMAEGKTPGLNIEDLQAQGITGAGVGIAIIDQALAPHAEFQNRLMLYKNFDKFDMSGMGSMHGAAVASIAAGETVGVAPGAYLYYISATFMDGGNGKFNSGPVADAIQYIVKVNQLLPPGHKIAVISISRGFDKSDNEREKFLSAVEAAKRQGIAVFTTDDVFTLSRSGFRADPYKLSSYTQTAHWLKPQNYGIYGSALCVPTDFRVTASPTGPYDYAAYSEGGLSWAVPYLAGLYALAAQVDPGLTKDLFMYAARQTADKIYLRNGVKVNYFINPAALMKELGRYAPGHAQR